MDILHETAGKFLETLLSLNLSDGLSAFLSESYKAYSSFILEYATKLIGIYDDYFMTHRGARRNYKVVKKDVPRTLETKFGTLTYERRYYRNDSTGEYRYLVDDLLDVSRYKRVEGGLAAELCELACDHSYQKSSHLACEGAVSRQTVMNLTRQVNEKAIVRERCAHEVKRIHLQCDEDHVAMQDGTSGIAKLCVIHEDIQNVGGSKRRHYLPERFIVVADEAGQSNEDFWFKVMDAIEDRYGKIDDLAVYIHGDAASWIKAGREYIPKSKLVLDKFHFSKYLNSIAGGSDQHRSWLWKAVRTNNYPRLKQICEVAVGDELCSEERANDFLTYYQRNRSGINIWYRDEYAGGSCAEGLVSHILSERLSSRPKAWGPEGLACVTRLRAHRLNGGQITPNDLKLPKEDGPTFKKSLKERLKTHINEFMPEVTDVFKTVKVGTGLYRLFNETKNGGYLF